MHGIYPQVLGTPPAMTSRLLYDYAARARWWRPYSHAALMWLSWVAAAGPEHMTAARDSLKLRSHRPIVWRLRPWR